MSSLPSVVLHHGERDRGTGASSAGYRNDEPPRAGLELASSQPTRDGAWYRGEAAAAGEQSQGDDIMMMMRGLACGHS